jgi:hypothetical protein
MSIETVDRPLLKKELEELNLWDRVVCQSYFTWYTFFVTFNGLALGWIFGNPRSDRPGLNYLFFLFAMWNAIGAVGNSSRGEPHYSIRKTNSVDSRTT